MNWNELPEYYRKIKVGAKGITKSILGVDLADEETIEKRREICLQCEFRVSTGRENSLGKCGVCGCYITHKTRLQGEKCPEGFW